jgi:hypothetical protein
MTFDKIRLKTRLKTRFLVGVVTFNKTRLNTRFYGTMTPRIKKIGFLVCSKVSPDFISGHVTL